MTTKVVTGKVRFSYLHVFRPHAVTEGQEPKYSVCLLIPKSDTVTKKKIEDAVTAAVAAKWPNKKPSGIRLPLRDGDAEEKGESYKGCWFVNVSSKDKPGVVDADLNPILDPTELVSGDYGRASINAFAYDQAGNKGVSFGLNNIQKLATGVPLGNKTRAEDDFAEDLAEEF